MPSCHERVIGRRAERDEYHRWPRRWALLAAVALIRAGQFSLLSILAPYTADKGIGATSIAAVFAVSLLGAACAQFVWARLAARFGPRILASSGALATAIAIVCFGLVDSVVLLAVCNFVATVAMSGAATSLRAYVAALGPDDLAERRFGQMTSAQTTGGLVGPLLLGILLVGGMERALWYCAGFFIVTALTLSVVPDIIGPHKAEPGDRPRFQDAHLPRLAPLLAVLAGTSILYGGYSVSWGLYLQHIHTPATLIAWSFAFFNIPMVLLAARADRLLGRIPRGIVIAAGGIAIGVFALAYATFDSVAVAMVLSTAEGALMALTVPVLYSQVATRLPPSQAPNGFAVMGAADQLSVLVGTVLSGAVIGAWTISASFVLLGAVCIALSLVGGLLGSARADTSEEGSHKIEFDTEESNA